MNLKGIAAKKLCEIEMGKIEDQFAGMWHNGRIEFPDINDDNEWTEFWETLSNHVNIWIDDLEEELRSEYKTYWKIYQEGRGGATFYPDGYLNLIGRRNNEITIEEIYGSHPDDENEEDQDQAWCDAYEFCRDFAKALTFFNSEVRGYAKSIPEWWTDDKAYQEAA